MTLNTTSGRYEVTASGVNSGNVLTYWFTYNKAGAQYDTPNYTWTKP
jgi:hypothetical protein